MFDTVVGHHRAKNIHSSNIKLSHFVSQNILAITACKHQNQVGGVAQSLKVELYVRSYANNKIVPFLMYYSALCTNTVIEPGNVF